MIEKNFAAEIINKTIDVVTEARIQIEGIFLNLSVFVIKPSAVL
ncbi:hypothetical protein ES705_41897 [subsurface metagenome]